MKAIDFCKKARLSKRDTEVVVNVYKDKDMTEEAWNKELQGKIEIPKKNVEKATENVEETTEASEETNEPVETAKEKIERLKKEKNKK